VSNRPLSTARPVPPRPWPFGRFRLRPAAGAWYRPAAKGETPRSSRSVAKDCAAPDIRRSRGPPVRPSSCPYAPEPAGRRLPRRRADDLRPRRRHAGRGHDRPRQHVRHRRVLPGGAGAGPAPDPRDGSVRRPGVPARAADAQGGAEPPSRPARAGPHGVPEPPAAFEQGLPGRLLLQAADRPRAAAQPCGGADRPLGLPERGGEPLPPPRPVRRGPGDGPLLPRRLRRQLLPRAAGPRDPG